LNSVYSECRERIDKIQEKFDDLLKECEEYKAFLIRKLKNNDNKKYNLVLGMQYNPTEALINSLDADPLDHIIEIQERVIRIKHWENGEFL
jgi:hypothetical protein